MDSKLPLPSLPKVFSLRPGDIAIAVSFQNGQLVPADKVGRFLVLGVHPGDRVDGSVSYISETGDRGSYSKSDAPSVLWLGRGVLLRFPGGTGLRPNTPLRDGDSHE